MSLLCSKTSVIANKLLSKEPTIVGNFTIVPEAITASSKLPRYENNTVTLRIVL